MSLLPKTLIWTYAASEKLSTQSEWENCRGLRADQTSDQRYVCASHDELFQERRVTNRVGRRSDDMLTISAHADHVDGTDVGSDVRRRCGSRERK